MGGQEAEGLTGFVGPNWKQRRTLASASQGQKGLGKDPLAGQGAVTQQAPGLAGTMLPVRRLLGPAPEFPVCRVVGWWWELIMFISNTFPGGAEALGPRTLL